MEKNFNKLFDINYKQKIITVFYDEFNRKTFLEKKNDKYDYLEYEDYVFLHNLFNASPFIRPIFEKFKYEEKVKLTSALLAVQILITGMLGCGCNVSLGNNAVLVTSSNTLTYYDHMDDLKKELGVVSPSNVEVYNSIDNNTNLPDNFKEIAHKIVDVLSSYNFDLTVFNLNIKDLIVDLKSLEEIKQYKENVVAYYDTSLNKIIASPDASESVITHELMHATNNFYRVMNNETIYYANLVQDKNNFLGVSLDEAMNVKLTNLVTEDKSYAFEVEVIDYLIVCTNYDFTTYSNTGIDGLITKLKENYPNFDVSYLLNLLDSNTMGEQAGIKALDAQENIIGALFSLALENIDENNLYSAFKNFSPLLNQDNYYVYLDKYLDKLNELGYSNDKTVIIDWLKIYQDVKMFIKVQGVVYPVKYKHFNESLGKDVYVVIDNNKSSQYIDNGSIIESNSSQFCFQDIMEEVINNLSVEDFSWTNFASKYGYFKENKEMILNNGR